MAIADPHPDLIEKARKTYPGVKLYADYVKMLDEVKPDAVMSTTPNNRHLEITRECAKRKIHLWFQKPMATSGKDAREMERLATEAGITLMIMDHTKFGPTAQTIAARLRAGDIGEVQRLHLFHRFFASKVQSDYYANYFREAERHGGGAITDQGTYGINWAICLLGRPESVYATGRQFNRDPRVPLEDHGLVIMNYPRAIAMLEGGWWARPDLGKTGRGDFMAAGPKGVLWRDDTKVYRELAIPDNMPSAIAKPELVETESIPPEMGDGVTHFLNALRFKKPIDAPHTMRVNVIVNEVVDAAYESIHTGRAVRMDAKR